MKANFKLFLDLRRMVFASLLLSVAAHGQTAVPFTLTWYAHDGGGGVCSGSSAPDGAPRYSLAGTVGQPDAVSAVAGTYTLQGGFLPAFQKTVGPTLALATQGNDLIFTWPASCNGFVLEGLVDLQDPSWDAFGSGNILNGRHQLRLRGPLVYRFFQLRKNCPR